MSDTSDELMVEIPVAQAQYMREQIGELTAEVARLKTLLDQKDATYQTIHVPTWHVAQAMEDNRDVEPGTVMRETDGQRREYVLGDDRMWRTR